MNSTLECSMFPGLAQVVRTIRETADTVTLEAIRDAEFGEVAFKPGQFNMIGLPGVGEVPLSISGNPANPKTLIHTLRSVGAVTEALTKLKSDQEFTVRGPFGSPWPVDLAEGKDVVVIAGGIGLAPLRPVIYHILGNREKYGHFTLLYGARSPSDILFRREVERWRSSFGMDVAITVDRSTPSWRGNVGFVTQLIKRAVFDPENTASMICGPEIMMRYSAEQLILSGVDPAAVYVSLERSMKCGIGLCGHCQMRSEFTCRSGPVYSYAFAKELMGIREL